MIAIEHPQHGSAHCHPDQIEAMRLSGWQPAQAKSEDSEPEQQPTIGKKGRAK